jgi:DNA-directed RNA polymerase subunit RPC12/RpoP
MRFSRSKRWRAYPELNGYSDEQCRVWIQQVEKCEQVSLRSRMRVAYLGATIFALLSTFTVVGGTVLYVRGPRPNPVLAPISLVIVAAQGTLIPFEIVRGTRYRWRGRMLRKLLSIPKCPWCKYPLVGLRTDDGDVRCPECGNRAMIEHAALMPGTVLPAGDGGRVSLEAEPTPSSPPPPA